MIGRLHRKQADASKKPKPKIKDSETLDELRREPNAHSVSFILGCICRMS